MAVDEGGGVKALLLEELSKAVDANNFQLSVAIASLLDSMGVDLMRLRNLMALYRVQRWRDAAFLLD